MMMDGIADSVSKSKLSACSDNLILTRARLDVDVERLKRGRVENYVSVTDNLILTIMFQSLDETTQHALTACVASFIYTKVVGLKICIVL